MKAENQPKRKPRRRRWQRSEKDKKASADWAKKDPAEIMKILEKQVEEGSPFTFALTAMRVVKNGSISRVTVEKDKEELQIKKVKKE